jgi:NAD(P)H dehydrogenase (quinone)
VFEPVFTQFLVLISHFDEKNRLQVQIGQVRKVTAYINSTRGLFDNVSYCANQKTIKKSEFNIEAVNNSAGCEFEMTRILIVYDSKSGNTERMAHAVIEGARQVKNVDVDMKNVDQTSLDDLVCADGIVFGSPTYFGEMSGKLKTFIDESVKVYGKLDGKVGAAFTSSGGTASGAETTLLSIIQAMLVHGMIVPGRSGDKHFGAAAVGSPQDNDLESCRDLGKRVAELASKLKK